MSSRSAVVAEALTWRLTPYHHDARIRGVGVDCAHLLIGVFAAVGMIAEFDPPYYPRDWMMHRDEERFLETMRDHAVREFDPACERPMAGDAVLYKVGRCFAHGAVVIDWPLILHADSRAGEVTLAEAGEGWLAGRAVIAFSMFREQA